MVYNKSKTPLLRQIQTKLSMQMYHNSMYSYNIVIFIDFVKYIYCICHPGSFPIVFAKKVRHFWVRLLYLFPLHKKKLTRCFFVQSA